MDEGLQGTMVFRAILLCPRNEKRVQPIILGISAGRFDFIEITERFAEDFEFFARHFLNDPIAIHRLNVNSEGVRRTYVTDPELRHKIASYHEKDMTLYRQALERREWESPGRG
jgi:hypothetical protein